MTHLRVDRKQLRMTEDYCYLYQDKPFTGIGLTSSRAKLIKETEYNDGARHGWDKTWDFDSGALVRQAWYMQNTRHGIEQCWYINGKRKSLELYEHGIRSKGVIWNQFSEIIEIYTLDEMDSLYEQLKLSREIHKKEPDSIRKEFELGGPDKKIFEKLYKELDEILEQN